MCRNQKLRVTSVYVLFLVAAVCFPWYEVSTIAALSAPANDAMSLAGTKRAWEERAKKSHSIRIQWDEDCYDTGVVMGPGNQIAPPAPISVKSPLLAMRSVTRFMRR